MSLICMNIRLVLRSDTMFSSGHSTPGGEDIALRLDQDGMPFLPGATLKGLLRESVGDCLRWTGEDPAALTALFGLEGWQGGESSPDLTAGPGGPPGDPARRLIFGDLRLEEGQTDWEITRTFTALEDQVVKTGTLRTASCLRKGLAFWGVLFCDQRDARLIQDGCAALKWAGLLRNRGFGQIQVTADPAGPLAHRPALSPTGCLRYRLELATALNVPQYRRSAGGWHELNYTDTRQYLPGSAVRGLLLSTLAREQPDWFAAHKAQLLGDGVRFLDALPVSEGQAAVPAPMGFYEDKGETHFYSVLTRREVLPQDKRAKLGSFCTLEAGSKGPLLRGCSPKTAAALRMRRGRTPEEKQVFSANAIAPGTVLEGYIQLDDPGLAPALSAAFYDWAWLGADKFAGYGLCRVAEVAPAQGRYGAPFGFSDGDQIPSELYMMLLSPTTMARAGEPVGLDEEALADLLALPPCGPGQKRLEITGCATAAAEQVGFNTTWGCATPAEVMYAPGSVFQLKCAAPPSLAALRRLEQTGLGLRRGEGCGQVLFLKDYPRYQKYRETGRPAAAPLAELRRARCRWLLETPVPGGLSNSQLGTIQALCERAMAQKGDLGDLRAFFDHNIKDKGARNQARYQAFREAFDKLMERPLAETLEVDRCPDGPVERLKLVCDWLDLSRKKVGR